MRTADGVGVILGYTVNGEAISGNTYTMGTADAADENNVAPFRYVNNATIQHLHVTGNIYTKHVHSGGIIGMAYGTTNITALGTALGKAPLSVTAGENVIIEAVAPVGDTTATYTVSGITAYAKGITRTLGEATTFYYGQGDDVSLTLSNTPPTALHTFSAYTVSGGATLSGSENPYTLTMLAADVTIGVTFTVKRVNAADVQALVNFILGRSQPEYDTIDADLNHDGHVNIADVTTLIQMIAE